MFFCRKHCCKTLRDIEFYAIIRTLAKFAYNVMEMTGVSYGIHGKMNMMGGFHQKMKSSQPEKKNALFLSIGNGNASISPRLPPWKLVVRYRRTWTSALFFWIVQDNTPGDEAWTPFAVCSKTKWIDSHRVQGPSVHLWTSYFQICFAHRY